MRPIRLFERHSRKKDEEKKKQLSFNEDTCFDFQLSYKYSFATASVAFAAVLTVFRFIFIVRHFQRLAVFLNKKAMVCNRYTVNKTPHAFICHEKSEIRNGCAGYFIMCRFCTLNTTQHSHNKAVGFFFLNNEFLNAPQIYTENVLRDDKSKTKQTNEN